MTIRQKALSILASGSDQIRINVSDPVSTLNGVDIALLNRLYGTNVKKSDIRSCRTIGDLLAVWEWRTNLPVNIENEQIKERINRLPANTTSKKPVVLFCDDDLSVVHIKTCKKINLIPLVAFPVIWVIMDVLYLSGMWWMFFSVLFSGFSQVCLLVLNYGQLEKEKLIVPISDLINYQKQQREYGFLVLLIAVVITIFNLFPLFAMSQSFVYALGFSNVYEGGVLVTIMSIIVIGLVWACFGPYISGYFENADAIENHLKTANENKEQQRQEAVARNYENIAQECSEQASKSLLYIICDEKSHQICSKILNELRLYLGSNAQILTPDFKASNEEKEAMLQKASIVLCLVDNYFINSVRTMHELNLASNMNKTILAGCMSVSSLPSNISKYIRREIHSLETNFGFNDLVLEIMPLVGCPEPLADAVGEHYEMHVSSESPYFVEFDQKKYSFTSDQIIHLYFTSGKHVVSLYNTSDIVVSRRIEVKNGDIKEGYRHFVDYVDLNHVVAGA